MKCLDSSDVRRTVFSPPLAVGLIVGAVCFLGALTPSLIPRSALVQGALAGVCGAIGYGLGAAGMWGWRFFGLPRLRSWAVVVCWRVAVAVAAVVVMVALERVTDWQNAVRAAVGMEPAETARPFLVAAVGGGVALCLVGAGRVVRSVARTVTRVLERVVPRRLARALALVVTAVLLWTVANGVLLRGALRGMDASYRQVDARIDPDTPVPQNPSKTGSANSLLDWDGLGRTGRDFIAGRPNRGDILSLTGEPALEPLRIYAGLNSADTPEDRAQLAFDEMRRVGAFQRQYLLIAIPTGTGWIDPAGLAPVEFLTRGDIATVAVQYSYLPSWLTLTVDTGYGAETAQAVFSRVYGHWRSLPRDTRPQLLLFGLSLGSVNAASALDLYEVIADPFAGALWAGPPFANPAWRQLVATRLPESPVWFPRHRGNTVVRFMGGSATPTPEPFTPGTMRVVYLQYPSDPIVFFTGDTWWRRSDLLRGPHPPGVSPKFRWFPVVTYLQLAFDMMIATTVPPGRGHVYSPDDYLDAWMAVVNPPDWNPDRIQALQEWLKAPPPPEGQ